MVAGIKLASQILVARPKAQPRLHDDRCSLLPLSTSSPQSLSLAVSLIHHRLTPHSHPGHFTYLASLLCRRKPPNLTYIRPVPMFATLTRES